MPPLAPDEKAAAYRDILRENGVESFFDLPEDIAQKASELLHPSEYIELPEGLNEATAAAYQRFAAAAAEKPDLSDAEVAALKESFVGEGAVQVEAVQP